MRLTILCCLVAACDAQINPPDLIIGAGNGAGGSGAGGTGAGNTGGSGTGGGIVDENPCGPVVQVAVEPMRRLSHDEYKNTLSDLQPTWATTVGTRAAGFAPDTESLGFRNGATLLDVKPTLAQQYMDAAEVIAAQAVTNLTALLPCTPTTATEAACATQFIKTFGRRLYRHTLSTDEVARLTTVYSS